MSSIHPLDRFIELREATIKGWREQRRAADRRLRSFPAIVQMHYFLVAFGSWALGFFAITPSLKERLIVWGLPAESGWLSFIAALLLWTVAITFPSGSIYRLERPWLLLLYSLLGAPLIIALADAIARDTWADFSRYAIFFPLLSLAFLMPTVGGILIIGGAIPEPLFLLATSVRGGASGLILPSYETLMRDIMRNAAPLVARLNSVDLEQIALIAEHKQSGINGRLQTLSLASGTLALLSLAALVVAQDRITDAIDNLAARYSQAAGETATPFGVPLLLFALLLLIAGLIGYVLRTYRELRLLEIMNVVCALRLAELAAPAQAALVTPTRQTIALQTSRTQPLALLAWMIGLGFLSRMLGRRNP